MLRRTLSVAVAAVALVLVPRAGHSQSAGTKRFVPEELFPEQMLVYFSIRDVTELREGLARTLLGRMVTHSGSRRAARELRRRLAETLAEGSAAFTHRMGMSPLEELALFEGEVAFGVRRIGPTGFPEAVIALELGGKADAILKMLSKHEQVFEEESGQELRKRRFGKYEATVWPVPGAEVFQVVIGSHLLLVSSQELLETIVVRYDGSGGGRSFKDSAVHAELQAALPTSDRLVVLEVDVPALRTLALSVAAMGPVRELLPGIVGATGIDRVSSLGFAAGFRDGGLEAAWHLGTRGGAAGMCAAIQAGLPGVPNVDAALARIPSTANDLSACRTDPGTMLRGIDDLLRKNFPWAAGNLDDLYRFAKEEGGVSVEDDLFAVGDATFYSFSVDPPAGGLLPDHLILVRTTELEPYWTVAKKLNNAVGGHLRQLEWTGGRLEYVDFTSVFGDFEALSDLLEGDRFPDVTALLAIVGRRYVVRSDLPDGWTVVSDTPQAVCRYVDHYAAEEGLEGTTELAKLARTHLTGASVASVSRGGSLVQAYNTIVSLASGYLGHVLAQAGIDPAQFPPGEVFLEGVRPGFHRLTVDRDGFTFHGHRPFESTQGILLATAVVGVVAGAALPAVYSAREKAYTSGREEAYRVACMSNLKNLYTYSILFGVRRGRQFPHSPKGSIASLQLLVDAFPDDFRPEIFICPGGSESPAATVGGRLTLTDGECSYEIVPWKLDTTVKDAILLYEKAGNHKGGRNVALTNGAVLFFDEETFQARLEEERRRFGG